jgi:TRAP-type mannitol/chloroaromatic compound transport system permease small subunit
MELWLAISRAIDRANEKIGLAVGWLTLAMVLIGGYNAIVRYLGRFMGWSLSSNAYIELQWYLFSLVFLLGAAYALRRGAHVRVDVFYGRLSARGKAWIDLGGAILFLVPFSVFGIWVSWPAVRNSWSIREVSPDPGGLPRYPVKTMILVAFALLILQGISEIVKQVAVLRRPPGDEAPPGEASPVDTHKGMA